MQYKIRRDKSSTGAPSYSFPNPIRLSTTWPSVSSSSISDEETEPNTSVSAERAVKTYTSYNFLLDAGVGAVPGSRVCSCPGARETLPSSTCEQTGVSLTHSSSITSSIVARSLGSTFNMRPMMCRVSRGSKRSNRHGPLTVSGLPDDSLAGG